MLVEKKFEFKIKNLCSRRTLQTLPILSAIKHFASYSIQILSIGCTGCDKYLYGIFSILHLDAPGVSAISISLA